MNDNIKKGGFLYLLKIAYRNIFRNLRRSILCISAVSLAVFLIIFMMSYIEGMLDSAKRIAQTFESGHIKITTSNFEEKEDFLPLQYPINNYEDIIKKIKQISGIKYISSRILSFGTFTNSMVKHGYIAGVDFEEIKNTAKDKNQINKYAYYNYTKKSNGLVIGKLPDNNKNECMIGYRLAKKMEIIPEILDKYEFLWLVDNLNDPKDAELFNKTYKFNKDKNIYYLDLFKNNNWDFNNGNKKLSKRKLKQIQTNSKEDYLKLLDIYMNLTITSIPIKIGKYALILDDIFKIDYKKEEFLTIYNFDNETGIYNLRSDVDYDKDYVLKFFQSAVTIRIPFKILSSQYSDKYYQPKLVGIFEYDYAIVDNNYVLIPFNKMQNLANLYDQTQCIYVFVDNLNKADVISKQIDDKINKNKDLIIKDWEQFPFIAMFRQFEFIYYIIYAIFIIMASFLIINTVIMIIHERIKEIGMMGALGMDRAEIILVFFLEALLLSILGSLGGTLLGALSTGIASNFPISMDTLTGGVDFPVSSTIFIKFSILILLKGFLFGTILTSFCTIFPSLKSAFIEPVEALRR